MSSRYSDIPHLYSQSITMAYTSIYCFGQLPAISDTLDFSLCALKMTIPSSDNNSEKLRDVTSHQLRFAVHFSPEMIVVAGGEIQSSRRNLPKIARNSFRNSFWKFIVIYIGGTIAIPVICPSDDPSLTSGGSCAASSP